jgi:hypothetical protein
MGICSQGCGPPTQACQLLVCLSLPLDLPGVRTDGITEKVSVGAYADSAYEYMLKQWLLSGRTDNKARDLCMISALSSFDPDSWNP